MHKKSSIRSFDSRFWIKIWKYGKMFGVEGLAIPLRCPKCEGRLVAVRYRPALKVLKERCWHFCNQCGFQQSIDEFKRMLLTV